MKPFAAQSELSCFQPPTRGKNFDNNTQHVISSQPSNHDGDDGDHDGDEDDYKDTVYGWSDFSVGESTGYNP